MLKGTKTNKVITSCMILSCATLKDVDPIRLAGTWSKYSKKAINQLTIAATSHGLSDNVLRCPYHAKVMNRFDKMSSPTVVRNICMGRGQTKMLSKFNTNRVSPL